MTLNPPLDRNKHPLRVDDNEYFIIFGTGIEFEINVSKKNKLKSSSGHYILTTNRLVLVNL